MSSSPPPPVVPHTDDASKSPVDATAVSGDADSSAPASTTNDQGDTHRNVGGFLQGKTFVQKIHSLLKITEYSSIISWNESGTAVTVHDVDAFISTVVPTHFKATKFGSFIRKMRRWGFSVITKKSSPSTSSTSSERGQVTVLEFSSEHFLRDQPDRCLFMKDERHVKKQFSFLDRNVKKVNDHDNRRAEGSALGYCFKQPQSSVSKTQTGENQSDTHPSGGSSSVPTMIAQNQYSYQSAMPPMMNNTMMQPPPPPPPPHQYQTYPYGYGPPPYTPPRGHFGSAPHSYLYPAPDGYPPYHSQPQGQNQVMHQNQQHSHPVMHQDHVQQDHQYHHMMNQNQHLPLPPTNHINQNLSGMWGAVNEAALSITPNGIADGTNPAAGANTAVVTSVSEESTELLPNTKFDLNTQIHSKLDRKGE